MSSEGSRYTPAGGRTFAKTGRESAAYRGRLGLALAPHLLRAEITRRQVLNHELKAFFSSKPVDVEPVHRLNLRNALNNAQISVFEYVENHTLNQGSVLRGTHHQLEVGVLHDAYAFDLEAPLENGFREPLPPRAQVGNHLGRVNGDVLLIEIVAVDFDQPGSHIVGHLQGHLLVKQVLESLQLAGRNGDPRRHRVSAELGQHLWVPLVNAVQCVLEI